MVRYAKVNVNWMGKLMLGVGRKINPGIIALQWLIAIVVRMCTQKVFINILWINKFQQFLITVFPHNYSFCP